MQKFNHPIALVYCKDNLSIATQIETDLAGVITFSHFACGRDEQISTTQMLQGFEGPILLLVSDNYLRTTQCMEQGLSMLNQHQENLLPVITPGYRLNDDGEKEVVLADFSRFKQVVQYINFWQDRYLALRQQKRNDPDLNNEGFSNYLHTVRDLAGEVAQYLRTLQTMDLASLETLSSNSYEVLFEFIDEPELWESFQTETNPVMESELADEDMDIANIPGLDLLGGIDSVPENEEIENIVTTSEKIVELVEATEEATEETNNNIEKIPATTPQTDSFTNYELALLYLTNSDQENAKKHFKRTLQLDDQHPFAHYDLALLFHKNNSLKKASKHYQKAILLNPELQTEQNDMAFKFKDKKENKKETIKALKARIEALEAQLVKQI